MAKNTRIGNTQAKHAEHGRSAMSDENKKNTFSPAFLKWVVIALLALVCFQVLSGGSLKKVALFDGEIEFFEKKHGEPPATKATPEPVITPPAPAPEDALNISQTVVETAVETTAETSAVEPSQYKPQTASISLAYSGDYYGCNLPISVRIGDQTVMPQGNVFQVNGVAVGNQPYSIAGQIHCPSIGSCQASGQGTINVYNGRQFNIVWQNTSYALCTVFLQ